jgi:hypothetical protein
VEWLSQIVSIGIYDDDRSDISRLSPNDPPATKDFIQKHAMNWVESEKPVDTPVPKSDDGCPCVSSGHTKHEWTSESARESVFKFLNSKVATKL